jgi:DNA-binding PadR family transcriptional regulator
MLGLMQESEKPARMTELESCVLGLIAQLEPCTAYQIRNAFEDSLTTSWRASTGSIYPLIRKLDARGLITSVAVPKDGRGSRLLRLTEPGRDALLTWLAAQPDWLGEPSADPIRTRSHFLELLPARERRSAVVAWLKATVRNIDHAKEKLARYRDDGATVDARAHSGAVMQLEARKAWLETLLDDPDL